MQDIFVWTKDTIEFEHRDLRELQGDLRAEDNCLDRAMLTFIEDAWISMISVALPEGLGLKWEKLCAKEALNSLYHMSCSYIRGLP